VDKINKNLHAVGVTGQELWCSESKKQTLYVILHVAGNHQVKKRYIYVQNKLVLFIQNVQFNMPDGRFIIWTVSRTLYINYNCRQIITYRL